VLLLQVVLRDTDADQFPLEEPQYWLPVAAPALVQSLRAEASQEPDAVVIARALVDEVQALHQAHPALLVELAVAVAQLSQKQVLHDFMLSAQVPSSNR